MTIFLTLSEYLEHARRFVMANYGHQLSENDDLISTVAHYMMRADEKFNGKGNRDSFRGHYAKFGAMKYFTQIRREKDKYFRGTGHTTMLPLNSEITKLCCTKTDFRTSYESCEQQEMMNYIFTSELLNAREKGILHMRYMENHTLQEIADEHGFSRERARQLLQKIIEKLQEHYDVESI
jgi:RNA polymerase sigma factor (sigma-70 family)